MNLDALQLEELDLGYLWGNGAVPRHVAPAPGEAPGPENRAYFTNFTFAAKEEDTEVPGISSVPPLATNGIGQGSSVQQDTTPDQVRPLRPQENNADMDQNGQFDGATLNNATNNISPPDPNPGPRLIDGSEASGNIRRRRRRQWNVTRRYMPPRNRRRPRNDGYVSEGTLDEYMRSSTSSESDSDSDTQSEQMNNGTENIEEGRPEPTNGANEQAGLAAGMPRDDRNIEEIAADIWNEHLGQHDTDTGRHGFSEDQEAPNSPPTNDASRLGPDETSNARTNNDNDSSEARETQANPGQAPPVLEPLRDPLQANESREPDEQMDFQTIDNAGIDEAQASNEAHSDAGPNAVPLPQLHFHYFLLLDRGTGVDPVPWTPERRIMELTWPQLERSLPVQLLTASDILLVRVYGFKEIKGRQEEFPQDDTAFDLSMKRLKGKVEEIQKAYSDLARIDLRIEIEAGMHFMRGPPLAEREPEASWF